MASKRTKAAPEDDLDSLFEGIPDVKKAPSAKKIPGKPAPEADILAELESELSTQNPPSRPHTPRAARKSDDKPAAAAARKSEDKGAGGAARKSVESARSLRASFTPSATSSDLQQEEKKAPAVGGEQAEGQQGGQPAEQQGGWWGSIFTHASAAMKTAEAAVKDLKEREEAKKWAEQVRGNVGVLRGFGDELRHRAMPTFTNILQTLAPPISSHERLHIHTTHDLAGYPTLDPLIHSVFSRVMSQVEGGDLHVVHRAAEAAGRPRSSSDAPAWRDGPWWRSAVPPRDMGIVSGLVEGTKLCRAGAESYASEYFSTRGGIEEARRLATEPLSETNPVRTSDLFLSVQAVGLTADTTLFARPSAAEREEEDSVVQSREDPDEQVCFAVFILDPVHEIEFSALSQAFPARWARWLDAAPSTPSPGSEDDEDEDGMPVSTPEEIKEIMEAGGVDPREWVAEWVEEVLGLAVGIVAQRYVARRMGVGEGGIGRGKKRMEEVVGEGAGEAARAGLI